MTIEAAGKARAGARTPFSPDLIIAAGCLIAVITFGPRSAIGQFQLPILNEFPIQSSTFSFAMALQYLFWGMGQPFAGAMADRFGVGKVIAFGTVLYALALALMVYSRDSVTFSLTAGVLLGFALSSSSFNLVIGAFQKLLPPERRPVAFGLGTAAGSFGQFLFSPLAGGMIQSVGWHMTSFVFAGIVMMVLPLTLFLSGPTHDERLAAVRPAHAAEVSGQSFRQALSEAFRHRSYVLLVAGFFTCGFQLSFVTVHFQRYVVESGLPPSVGYWAFALVGMCNIVGSMTSGWLSGKIPRRWILSFIYLSRALVTLAFIMLPATPLSTYMFGILTGFLWLSTVPPTSSLIGVMFGTRYFSTLYGLAFFNHQVGGFCGLVLAGWMRDLTGSYMAVWWLSIALGVFSAIVNLPIVEKPVNRDPVPAAA